MSNPDPASVPPTLPPSPAPPPRNGCLTAFMVVAGIVMLLPGLCALIFGFASLSETHFDSSLMPLIVLGLLVGFGGIMLIRAATRGGRRQV